MVKLIIKVRLEGKRISIIEDAPVDTGSTFTLAPPEIVDRLEDIAVRAYKMYNLTV